MQFFFTVYKVRGAVVGGIFLLIGQYSSTCKDWRKWETTSGWQRNSVRFFLLPYLRTSVGLALNTAKFRKDKFDGILRNSMTAILQFRACLEWYMSVRVNDLVWTCYKTSFYNNETSPFNPLPFSFHVCVCPCPRPRTHQRQRQHPRKHPRLCLRSCVHVYVSTSLSIPGFCTYLYMQEHVRTVNVHGTNTAN
jgi:hypothetical protein